MENTGDNKIEAMPMYDWYQIFYTATKTSVAYEKYCKRNATSNMKPMI
jgi:hypothetical protein